ncbi:ComF family protein [Serinicoccus sp. LYQ131]|uniref:ComF family protein n=1 Tax=Serinicoccus sp. LYQ131 TaxID=3378797 RepID=UPI0038532A8E
MPWRPGTDLRALLELAAPSGCGGCEARGSRWCPACDAVLRATPPRRWWPTPTPPGMPPTWAGPAYQGVVRAAVVAWKESDRVDLTHPLSTVLTAAVSAALLGSPEHRAALAAGRPVPVVPAPSARSSTRARGRAPVRELARTALGPGVVVDALLLGRPVHDQAGLSAAERARNLAGALTVRTPLRTGLRDLPCVVVDDVVTTGSTLAECARALSQAGSGPVVAAVVAATARHPTGPLPPVVGAD